MLNERTVPGEATLTPIMSAAFLLVTTATVVVKPASLALSTMSPPAPPSPLIAFLSFKLVSLTLLPPSPIPAAMPHLVCFPPWSTLLPVFSVPLSRLPQPVSRCVPIPGRRTIPPTSWDFRPSLLVMVVFAVTRLSSLVLLPYAVSASSMLTAIRLRRLLAPFPRGNELTRESLLRKGLR